MIAEPVRAAAVAAEIDHKIRRVRTRASKVFGIEIPAGQRLTQNRRGNAWQSNKTDEQKGSGVNDFFHRQLLIKDVTSPRRLEDTELNRRDAETQRGQTIQILSVSAPLRFQIIFLPCPPCLRGEKFVVNKHQRK